MYVLCLPGRCRAAVASGPDRQDSKGAGLDDHPIHICIDQSRGKAAD